MAHPLVPTDWGLPWGCNSSHTYLEALFAGQSRFKQGTALEARFRWGVVDIFPWFTCNGNVAGCIAKNDEAGLPLELGKSMAAHLLSAHEFETVPLTSTPAPDILEDVGEDDIGISWHARRRYCERVKCVYPIAPRIRRIYHTGVPVGINGGEGIYHPPSGQLVVYSEFRRTRRPYIRSVWVPSEQELRTEHLHRCRTCGDLVDPRESPNGTVVENHTCPWCGDQSAGSTQAAPSEI